MRFNKKSAKKIEWKSAVNFIKLKPENCLNSASHTYELRGHILMSHTFYLLLKPSLQWSLLSKYLLVWSDLEYLELGHIPRIHSCILHHRDMHFNTQF